MSDGAQARCPAWIRCEVALLGMYAAGQSELDDLLQRVADSMSPDSDILRADAASVYVTEATGSKAVARATSGYQREFRGKTCPVLPAERVEPFPTVRKSKLGITSWVISTGLSFLAESPEELRAHPHWLGKWDQLQRPGEDMKVASFLAVPLRDVEGKVIGALKAERLAGGKALTRADQVVMESLTRTVSRCIRLAADSADGGRLPAITTWARELIAEALTAAEELDAFLDAVTRITAAAMSADACAVFLVDELRQTLTQRAGSGHQELKKEVRAYDMPERGRLEPCRNLRTCKPGDCTAARDLPPDQRVGLTAWVASTGKTFHATNWKQLQHHCHWKGQYDKINYAAQEKCGAWLGVPLRLGGTVTGVLKVENVEKSGTTAGPDFADKVHALALFAQDVALAIERLEGQINARYRIVQEAMPTVNAILQSDLDIPDLVQTVVTETARLFNARACALFLADGRRLIQPPWAAYGWAKEGPPVREYTLPAKPPTTPRTDDEKVGLTVWIAAKREQFVAKSNRELKAHPHHRGVFDPHNFRNEEKCESFMGTPMLVGDDLIGVLKVETKMTQSDPPEFAYFTDMDVHVLGLIASTAAAAIARARVVEPRRLVEQISKCPSGDAVFERLHEYQSKHVYNTAATVGEAARELGPHDQERAGIAERFAQVLRGDFGTHVLAALAQDRGSALAGLLERLADAMKVTQITEIAAFPVAPLPQESECLHDLAEWWFRAAGEASECTARYLATRARAELQAALQNLARHDAVHLSPFDRHLIGQARDQWSRIIVSELKPRAFVGHGHANDWKQLRTHLVSQQVQVEEFDAGQWEPKDVADNLAKLLESVEVAFLVMTGEDEATGNGHTRLRARQNVIHEAGLFQGRLGWRRVVLIVERDVELPSNLSGLTRMDYERHRIDMAFPRVTEYLRGQGLI